MPVGSAFFNFEGKGDLKMKRNYTISLEAVKKIAFKARQGKKIRADEWAFVTFVRHSFGAQGFKKACQILKKAGI